MGESIAFIGLHAAEGDSFRKIGGIIHVRTIPLEDDVENSRENESTRPSIDGLTAHGHGGGGDERGGCNDIGNIVVFMAVSPGGLALERATHGEYACTLQEEVPGFRT